MNLVQARRQSWNLGIVVLVLILGFWRINQLPQFGAYEARTFILGILPIALLSMGQAIIIIGGGINQGVADLIGGKDPNFIPPLVWLILPLLVIWIPLYRSRTGIAMYAIGSNKDAAFLSGVNVNRTRIKLYAVGGLFAGLSGVVLTGITLSASPFATISNTATLNSVAGAVLGGVSLAGGVGGLAGPAMAALVLYFIPNILLAYGIDPAYSQIITGALTIFVVLVGGLLRKRTGKT